MTIEDRAALVILVAGYLAAAIIDIVHYCKEQRQWKQQRKEFEEKEFRIAGHTPRP